MSIDLARLAKYPNPPIELEVPGCESGVGHCLRLSVAET